MKFDPNVRRQHYYLMEPIGSNIHVFLCLRRTARLKLSRFQNQFQRIQTEVLSDFHYHILFRPFPMFLCFSQVEILGHLVRISDMIG